MLVSYMFYRRSGVLQYGVYQRRGRKLGYSKTLLQNDQAIYKTTFTKVPISKCGEQHLVGNRSSGSGGDDLLCGQVRESALQTEKYVSMKPTLATVAR